MSEETRSNEQEASDIGSGVTHNDRFSSILVVFITVAALGLGLIIKQASATDTWSYASRETGIAADYPAGWLADESGGYAVRLRDPKSRPFKTQYVITVTPMGGQTSVRNVLDGLTLQRSIDLSAYRVLNVEEVHNGGATVTRMNFAFVETDPSPFIQRLPVAVLGTDTVILDGNRAIVVTYMSDKETFEANRPSFERFLSSLRY